jgi:hypothetical protein
MNHSVLIWLALPSILISPAAAQQVRAPAVQPGQLEQSSWFSEVSGRIQRDEYRYSPVDGAANTWSAPSRAQDLRSRISANGIELTARTADVGEASEQWTASLATTRFGRVDSSFELTAATVTAEGERVELAHGPLTEWFVNDARGIEQGWTIARPPAGAGPVWIGLEVGGDLCFRIDAGARSGVFVDANGAARVRYTGLLAFDASGRELAAQIATSPHGIGIAVDDSNAKYPLTVDPVLSGPTWTAESDQDSAFFGRSVACAGDVNGDGFSDVIVAAPLFDGGETDEGRVFVYLGSASGLSASADWTAEIDQASAEFGASVATAGDVNGDGFSDVIVGAVNPNPDDDPDGGAAFVYLGSASGLEASAAWTAESDQDNSHFGSSVATAGDVNGDGFSDVIVGAYLYDNGEVNEGRAFVYLGSASGLSTSVDWTAESDQSGAAFGFSVASAGDVDGDGFDDVIVGAQRYLNGEFDEGRSFVYHGSGSGLSVSANWTAESDQVWAWFGTNVATAGDVNADGFSDVIVGAPLFTNGETSEGRSFVYLGSGTGLSTVADWTAEGDQAFALFGWSAATAGDVNGDSYSDVIVGAYSYDNGVTAEGQARVYLGTSTGLSPSPAWTIEGDQAAELLGRSVGTAGDVNGDGYSDVIVGASEYDNGETDEGRAFVYYGSADGLAASSAWTAEGNQAGALFGSSVANAGDVNGDGFGDVIVGAPQYDNGETDEGRAFVYLGSSTGLDTTAAWTGEPNQAAARYGVSVACAGDVNGDGYSDVIVGAQGHDNVQMNEGRAFVYHGSSTGLATSPSWTGEPNQSGAFFGSCVASAGDVNGDGYSDVIIGAYLFALGQADEGVAAVYLGSANGLKNTFAWATQSNQISAFYGWSVASAGDVNGDGFSDVVVGAYSYDGGQMDEGRAYLYEGSSSGLSTTAAWTSETDQAGALYGYCVASAGDVNGDGYSDVFVGAPQFDNGQSNEGRVSLYLGSASGLSTSVAWTAESNQTGAAFGSSVAAAGDVNGDNHTDVIIGADGYDNGELNEGRAFLYLGSSSGPAASPAWTAESNQLNAAFGHAVSPAGDVNGDGYADVIVGATAFSSGRASEGRAFVYLGNDGRGGWTLAPRQRQANDAAPIHPLGHCNDKDEFRIALDFDRELTGFGWATGASPTARLQWQLALLHESLDASPMDLGASHAINGTPIFVNELVSFHSPIKSMIPNGLAHFSPTGGYHWRVRLRTNNPVFPVTPWVTIAWNSQSETKLHVGRYAASHTPR